MLLIRVTADTGIVCTIDGYFKVTSPFNGQPCVLGNTDTAVIQNVVTLN